MSPLEIALIVMVVMFIIGMPIYMSLCIAAAVTLVCGDILPLTIIHNSLFDGLNLFRCSPFPASLLPAPSWSMAILRTRSSMS